MDVCFAIVLEESTNNFYIVDMYKGSNTYSLSATIGAQYNRYYYKQYTTASALASPTTAYTDNLYYKFSPSLAITSDLTLAYTNTDMSYCSTSGTARVMKLSSATGCLSTKLNSAKLYAQINLGTDYEFGSKSVFADSTGSNITIRGYNSSGVQILSGTARLVINQVSVEKLYELDIKSFTYGASTYSYTDLSFISANISGYISSSNANVNSALRFNIWTSTEYKVDATSTSTMITLNSVSTATSPVQFSWTPACTNIIPKYEFQLLRLYNESSTYDDDITKAKLTVDWTKALDIII